MYRILAKAFLIGQVIASLAVIVGGIAYSLRCLCDNQTSCAVCFAAIAYVSGYRLLYKASVRELRNFNTQPK